MDYLRQYASPLGSITICSDGEALTGLWFDGQRHDRAGLTETAGTAELPILQQAADWLDRYFAGNDPGTPPLLRPRGSVFAQAVWRLLLCIPFGQTVSYGALAAQLAARTGRTRPAAQAVGRAVGHNPISLMIPCHRVVGADGALTGYAGGLERKRALLALECGAGTAL